MSSRKFFYVSLGILALVGAFNLGASSSGPLHAEEAEHSMEATYGTWVMYPVAAHYAGWLVNSATGETYWINREKKYKLINKTGPDKDKP